MAELINFHFEGGLSDEHRMNFYEAARFQYAAARLLVKLSQFRQTGAFKQKIFPASNPNIQLSTQADGSFNINIVDEEKKADGKKTFVKMSLAELVAFVTEPLVEKIDETEVEDNFTGPVDDSGSQIPTIDSEAMLVLNEIMDIEAVDDERIELVKRRVAELNREKILARAEPVARKIDDARGRKLMAMAAPLVSEMSIALRESASTLEIRSGDGASARPIFYLNKKMASEIETAAIDKEPFALLGDIEQFNKNNGWGKIKYEDGAKIRSFQIPYQLLPTLKQRILDAMKKDLVNLKVHAVRNPADEVIRLIAVDILATPPR
ncbi:hypothetical protein [Rhizobium rhizogenes]|uniref:hypothetical protein n=1 Tax=Rhizobium rhizogenes TaxID=359 RepID=UPI0022C0116E|nr:hypothetical protein [Rhizobium rhizogenes]MCZ7466631.1 hypothetical protein [Rhizobium rhizogenes]